MSIVLKAKIEKMEYHATFNCAKLSEFDFTTFDINDSDSSFNLKYMQNLFSISKWVSPKRTRSEPFSRIYKTYSSSFKRITVIPIIKDEGQSGDLDRINSLTLAWMNLTNVYIVLAYYDRAEINKRSGLTNQKFNNDYVKKKILEINKYQYDAHHWNVMHFKNDFIKTMEAAIDSYKSIELALGVKLHSRERDKEFLEQNSDGLGVFDIGKFIKNGISKSLDASKREAVTDHKLENLTQHSEKAILNIVNNLGGEYYLTVDELIKNGNSIILQESKNSSKQELPSIAEIQDALFKIMLFKNISRITDENGTEISFSARISLTGCFKSNISIVLPFQNSKSKKAIEIFSTKSKSIIEDLNKEAIENNIQIIIRSNTHGKKH